VTLWACKPCVEVRGLAGAVLDRRIKLGGMNDFHAAAKRPDARMIGYRGCDTATARRCELMATSSCSGSRSALAALLFI
jgi:hypothetical protein